MDSRTSEIPAPSVVDRWLSLADEIQTFVTSPPMATSRARAPESHLLAGRILMFQWGRSFRTFGAIVTLIRGGYSEDSTVLLRTLLEVLFEMTFIARFPEDAELFMAHGLRAQAGSLRRLREGSDLAPEIQAALGALEARSLAQSPDGSMKPKNATRSSWHPKYPSVRSRAIAAGMPSYFYDLLYSFASRYVHGSSDWMVDFLAPPPEGSRVSYLGDMGESALAVSSACRCILEELRILDGCLSLEL